jgi:hypothetical protein
MAKINCSPLCSNSSSIKNGLSAAFAEAGWPGGYMPNFLTDALTSRKNATNWSDVGLGRVLVSISNVIGNKRLGIY